MVHSREGTKRCLVFMGLRSGPFCVLLLKKMNNMLFMWSGTEFLDWYLILVSYIYGVLLEK